MRTFENDPCPWADRVSAHIDGEIQADQVLMLEAHLKICQRCRTLIEHEARVTVNPQSRLDEDASLTGLDFPIRATALNRTLLAIVGVLILIGSIPAFGRGNTGGDTLHDLRHLAIWQVAIGVAVVTAAITFRISRLLATMLVTFLILTVVATLYDLVTGHRGPWADPLHVIEVVAVLVVLRLALPYRHLAASAKRLTRPRFDYRYGSRSVQPHNHRDR